jgi:hypothetical protein
MACIIPPAKLPPVRTVQQSHLLQHRTHNNLEVEMQCVLKATR